MGDAGQPSGTVTFLFTDVVDHTRLWEQHPDAMPGSLERHDEILREMIARHDGYVFSTAGDAFAAAFPSADRASSAACDAQQAFAVEVWPEGCALRVRMALHTGEAQERDGDYFGPAVIRAARLMSLAQGGQVLVSGATAALLLDEVEFATMLRHLGEVELRGLGRVEQVSELRYPGLSEEFAPLSRDRVGNLPVVADDLIGRDELVHTVSDLIGPSSLVTLVGPGGVGKTRLSIEVGSEIADRFEDGVWFVPLASVTDGSAVPQAVAEVLGVQEAAGRSLTQSVVSAIAGRRLLLILDNCEHVVAEARRLAEAVVSGCATVTVLTTSRERLGLAGETVLPVAPLPIDTASNGLAPSVQLFVARAASADPAFAIDAETAAKVTEICRGLDGMPLAIELAAARVRGLGLDGLAEHLGDRFRLLRSRSSDDPRHETLRSTVQWSYDLLDESLREVFCRAGVFAGSFTRDAAESVLAHGDLDALDVADGLAELVDKSMLQVVEGRSGRRYRMLETMRQFGAANLGTAERGRTRHQLVGFMARWSTDTDRRIAGEEVPQAIRGLRDEYDNLREAFRLAVEADDIDAAATIVLALYEFALRAVVGESWRWAEELLPRMRPTDQHFGDVLLNAVWGCRARGDRARGEELVAMYEAAEAAGELTPTGFSELQLGITYWFWRQTERSVQLQERALVSYRAAGDRHGVSLVLATLSMAQDSFDRAAAERSARQAIAIGRESGNPIEVCGGLLALAGVVAHSEAGRAADLAAEILEIANRAELIWYEATAARLRAHALSRAGRLSEASDAYARAIALNGVGDFGELLWYTVFNVVEHLARIGEPDAAAVALGAFREAPAAPSDDLIARATDRLARQVADTFGSDDLAVEAQERGRTMRLADLLRLLQQRLAAHATT